jgi:8-oxo-dGTP pyrophosphatase MutT (NUDIX family)
VEPINRRRSARCLVLDSAGRVLLLRWIDRRDGLPVWFTPGGGIDDGETPDEAARRELREETGIVVQSVGRLIMHQVVRSGELIRDEDHFVVRFDGEPRSPTAPDPGTDGWRWWRLSEIETSTELFHPRNVGHLLAHALGGRADPIEDDLISPNR